MSAGLASEQLAGRVLLNIECPVVSDGEVEAVIVDSATIVAAAESSVRVNFMFGGEPRTAKLPASRVLEHLARQAAAGADAEDAAPEDAAPPPLQLVDAGPAPASCLPCLLPQRAVVAISDAHRIPSDGLGGLRALLAERGLWRMQALLANPHAPGGEFFAEHARAQLSESSGCDSRPAWVAWLAEPAAAAGPEEAAGGRLLALWAEDSRAARRCLLALELQRGDVRVVVGALPRSLLPQLERWAYEHEGFALAVLEAAEVGEHEAGGAGAWALPHALRPTERRANECWVTLTPTRGAARERLQSEREAAGESDAALAWRNVEELSRRLLLLDPAATMQVAPAERAGSFSLHEVSLKGHSMYLASEIDRHSNVDDLVNAAQASCCTCCVGGARGFGDPL